MDEHGGLHLDLYGAPLTAYDVLLFLDRLQVEDGAVPGLLRMSRRTRRTFQAVFPQRTRDPATGTLVLLHSDHGRHTIFCPPDGAMPDGEIEGYADVAGPRVFLIHHFSVHAADYPGWSDD